MKHKHAELIHAWADGAEIECKFMSGNWRTVECPDWSNPLEQYRIKPTPRQQWQQDLIDAARAGKVIEHYGCGGFIKSDLNTSLDKYNFYDNTQEYFRIRPEKVTRYLWAVWDSKTWFCASNFYAEQEAKEMFPDAKIKRLDWSATEFEE